MDFEKVFADLPNDLISGVVIATTASALWAFILKLSNHLRCRAIEKSIRKSLQPDSVMYRTRKSIGIDLENDTMIPVVVRSVEIRGGEGGAFEVSLSLHDESQKEGVVSNERGWVEMPGKTDATWHLNFESHDPDSLKQCLPIETIGAVVEYKTILGTTQIIDIEAKSQLDWIRRAFEENLAAHTHVSITEPASDSQKA